MSSTLMCRSARWKLLCLALGSLYFRSTLINWGGGWGGITNMNDNITDATFCLEVLRLHLLTNVCICLCLTSSVSVMSTVPSASSSIILWMLRSASKLSREFSSWQSGWSITQRSATREQPLLGTVWHCLCETFYKNKFDCVDKRSCVYVHVHQISLSMIHKTWFRFSAEQVQILETNKSQNTEGLSHIQPEQLQFLLLEPKTATGRVNIHQSFSFSDSRGQTLTLCPRPGHRGELKIPCEHTDIQNKNPQIT